jgi:L,D-transpeptidase ErfK/SrfK
MRFRNLPIYVVTIWFLSIAFPAYALVYYLPKNGNNIIGSMRIVQTEKRATLYKLRRHYEMGHNEMVKANPRLPRYRRIKRNQAVVIPSFFILPDAPRTGIVINLPELRLYYYPPEHNVVITEPVALGKLGWSTPLLMTEVIEKIKNPPWVVPESIREYNAYKGIYLPQVVPPGPKNPLGKFALRLGAWSVLIHGTIMPQHIGKRVSSGCIRMYPEDIKYLFHAVVKGTPVRIIDQPYKVGWLDNDLYLEAHLPFLEARGEVYEELEKIRQLVLTATFDRQAKIDWHAVVMVLAKHTGIPSIIGKAV